MLPKSPLEFSMHLFPVPNSLNGPLSLILYPIHTPPAYLHIPSLILIWFVNNRHSYLITLMARVYGFQGNIISPQ